MDQDTVRKRAAELPQDPGVYQFRAGDTALYIGKAVDLRSRVRSYADPRSARIEQMLSEADGIEIAVTDTETQALLLEANLIKRHSPRYNVRLTDDKSYPLLQLTDHEYPRIEVTRDPDEAAQVWGPYTNVGRVETVVKALREMYGVRGCSDHKFANRTRPCLDYDMGLCTAPCTNEISDDAYLADVQSVERFLDGATGVLGDPLESAMDEAAEAQQFERAAHLRDRLEAVAGFHGGDGQAIQSPDEWKTMDVIAAVREGQEGIVARLRADGGKLVGRDQHVLEAPVDASVAAVIRAFVAQFYAERDLPDALVLSDHPDDAELTQWLEDEGVAVSVPRTGREARLVELALKNARSRTTTDESQALADALGLESAGRIEGFDVSHAGGTAVVGSNVVFVNGGSVTDEYRRKKLDDHNDDPGNMEALLRWRATRAIEGRDTRPDPDLLLVDGGTAQVNAAEKALEDTGWDVPVIGLAKADERVITQTDEYNWPADAAHLHLLQRIRDEAHRFAVRYHQTVRDDISTVLDDVPGVGPELRKRLLRRFGSVEGIRTATDDELQAIDGIGAARAAQIQSVL